MVHFGSIRYRMHCPYRHLCRWKLFFEIAFVTMLTSFLIAWYVSNVRNNVAKRKVDTENNAEVIRSFLHPRTADMLLEQHNAKRSSEILDLRIIVMVYDRALSLKRLLHSLNKAHYYDARVILEVWIDRIQNGTIDARTYDVAKSFKFSHGKYRILNQTRHSGIYGQWMGTWKPSANSSEIGILLEDDLSLSPYFYKWLRTVHTKYDHLEHVNGYSLQGVSIVHGIHAKSKFLNVSKRHRTFLYPILGTWGFSPKVKNWLKFLSWYEERVNNWTFQPIIEGIWPSEWYKTALQTGTENTIWEMWHIYHAWQNKELTLYSNYPGQQGLAINWREPGLHYSISKDDILPDPLLLDWKSEYEDLPAYPAIVDVNGEETIKDPNYF